MKYLYEDAGMEGLEYGRMEGWKNWKMEGWRKGWTKV